MRGHVVNETTVIRTGASARARAIESKKSFLLALLSTRSKIQRLARSLDGDGASVKFNEPVNTCVKRAR